MNNFEKHRSPKEAHEEVQKLQEEAESKGINNYNKAETRRVIEKENQEKGLSSEIVEKIMEKVQDINEKGTAYTVVYSPSLRNIYHEVGIGSYPDKTLIEIYKQEIEAQLIKENEKMIKLMDSLIRDGILAAQQVWMGSEEWDKNKWYEALRKKKVPKEVFHVCFNIVGRSYDIEPGQMEIKNSFYCRGDKQMPKVVFLFDLSSFKEAEPTDYIDDSRDWQYFEPKSHTYYPQQEEGSLLIWQEFFRKSKLGSPEVINHPQFNKLQEQRELDEQGFPMVSSEWGFALHYRVAPRFFKGIIYKGNNPEDFVRNIENIYRDVYVDKLSQAFSVYDIDGNLLWPQKKGYEDVKRFVNVKENERRQSRRKSAGGGLAP